MRIFSYFVLVGAAVLVTHLTSGADAFTIGRNVTLVIDMDDSHETTNISASTEALDNFHLLIEGQQPSDYSWDDLMDDIGQLDRANPTDNNNPVQHVVDHDDSLEDVLEHLVVQKIMANAQTGSSNLVDQQPNVPASEIAVAKSGQQNLEIWNTSSIVGFVVEDDDDFSLEDYSDFHLHHHLPDTLYTLPMSDDWFLVKHFMDDHYVWEIEDELAKEYFWQPVKASDGLVADSQPVV